MLYSYSVFGEDFYKIIIVMIATVMALFVAMPFREFAKAFVARREGDYTSVALKRYTLAPLAHIDIIGFIFLLLFRFGWSKPLPIDERNFKRGRKSKFLVYSAGIITNLVLAVLFLFIYMLLLKVFPQVYDVPFYGFLLEEFLTISVSYNFMLAIFHILPIYPMDGFKIVESFSRSGTNAYLDFMRRYYFVIFLVLAITGIYGYIYRYTAGYLINWLIKLFSIILGL
ncbi:MAG: site-2 protease family protein [Clostridia bacterium]|nr:site-2 protease family protein [Clostridia bacterium]